MKIIITQFLIKAFTHFPIFQLFRAHISCCRPPLSDTRYRYLWGTSITVVPGWLYVLPLPLCLDEWVRLHFPQGAINMKRKLRSAQKQRPSSGVRSKWIFFLEFRIVMLPENCRCWGAVGVFCREAGCGGGLMAISWRHNVVKSFPVIRVNMTCSAFICLQENCKDKLTRTTYSFAES